MRFALRYWGSRRVIPKSPSRQICYAVATDGDRRYVDLAAISALAAKQRHPSLRVTILTDDHSLPMVSSWLAPHGLAKSVRSVGRCPGQMGVRSRFAKTQVRKFVDGDVLYLDADAIPVADFDELFEADNGPVCAAIDRSPGSPAGSGFPSWAAPAFERLGWPHPTDYYLNSGVVLWRDTPVARQLGRLWHENWRRFFKTSADFADQPAFNYSMRSLGISPTIMSDRFNARVGLSPAFRSGASIYHFYASDDALPTRGAIEDLLGRFQNGEKIGSAAIDKALVRSYRDRLVPDQDPAPSSPA
jgi:hypothetical protein